MSQIRWMRLLVSALWVNVSCGSDSTTADLDDIVELTTVPTRTTSITSAVFDGEAYAVIWLLAFAFEISDFLRRIVITQSLPESK